LIISHNPTLYVVFAKPIELRVHNIIRCINPEVLEAVTLQQSNVWLCAVRNVSYWPKAAFQLLFTERRFSTRRRRRRSL